MRYAAYEPLVAPARPSAAPALLVAGLAVLVALFMLFSLIWAQILPVVFGAGAWARIGPGVMAATTPLGVLVNLFTFVLLVAALGVALRAVHRRGLMSLIGPRSRALRQFGRTLGALGVLYVVISLVPMPEAVTPERNLAPGLWLAVLPLGILALLVQVFAEEAVFRGYLQSQLAARFASPAIWLGLPALGFGLLHLNPALPGASGWLVVVWATGFGLVAGDLTARFGTLGPATALHLVNNFGAILIAAPRGQFDGLALYVYPFSLTDEGAVLAVLPVDLAMLLCSWLAIRLALRG